MRASSLWLLLGIEAWSLANLASCGGHLDLGSAREARDVRPDGGTQALTSVDSTSSSSNGPSGAERAANRRSVGCDKQAKGAGKFETHTLQIAGRPRSYHVRVPSSYRPGRAYPVVFRWHGHGGDGLAGGLDIEYALGDEGIVVAADGLDRAWTDSSEPNDLLLFDAMYEALGARYCLDLARVFAYGFSQGGGMANLLACKRADKLRGSAAIAGLDRGQGACGGSIAAWLMHDDDDPAVNIGNGLGARDALLKRNGCTSQGNTDSDGCLHYQGCAPGYPLVWCQTAGRGHDIAGDVAPARVWAFFSGLP